MPELTSTQIEMLKAWRCPDCGSGVTKVHMTAAGPAPCGKAPGYWSHDCYSCGGETAGDVCPASEQPCGHHCNHSWSHERCCWCGKEWGEQE